MIVASTFSKRRAPDFLVLAAVLCASTAFGGGFPRLMLRLSPGNTETDARWEETLDIIKRAPGCCDDVWFSTGTGVPHLSWRRERAARIARASSELRAVGIGASLQVQATIDLAWRRARNRRQPRNGAWQPQDVSGRREAALRGQWRGDRPRDLVVWLWGAPELRGVESKSGGRGRLPCECNSAMRMFRRIGFPGLGT